MAVTCSYYGSKKPGKGVKPEWSGPPDKLPFNKPNPDNWMTGKKMVQLQPPSEVDVPDHTHDASDLPDDSDEKVKSSSGDSAGYLDAKVAKSIVVLNDMLQLSGDSESPGAGKFYGTNSEGVRAWLEMIPDGDGGVAGVQMLVWDSGSWTVMILDAEGILEILGWWGATNNAILAGNGAGFAPSFKASGTAAWLDVGTGAGTVAEGDHDHDGVYSPDGHSHDGRLWEVLGANLWYSLGNVGIGTNSPDKKLDVVGDARVSGELFADLKQNRLILDNTADGWVAGTLPLIPIFASVVEASAAYLEPLARSLGRLSGGNGSTAMKLMILPEDVDGLNREAEWVVPGDLGVLPDQTGNDGKFLSTTEGEAFWAEVQEGLWTEDGDDISWNGTGGVAIGKTSAENNSKLDVNGGVAVRNWLWVEGHFAGVDGEDGTNGMYICRTTNGPAWDWLKAT